MNATLLDTDTLSEIIRRRQPVISRRAEAYLTEYGKFTFSLMTRYEILRGLKSKNAARQLQWFQAECLRHHVLPISDDVIELAADLYAYLRTRGKTIGDGDLFIAATARLHNLVLATNNIDHFIDIPALAIESWAKP